MSKTLEGEYEIGCLQLKGAAFQRWIEFKKKNYRDVLTKSVSITSFKDEKKGAIQYKVPVFSIVEIAEEEQGRALELDKILQEYFNSLFNKEIEEQVDEKKGVEVSSSDDITKFATPIPKDDEELPLQPSDDDLPF